MQYPISFDEDGKPENRCYFEQALQNLEENPDSIVDLLAITRMATRDGGMWAIRRIIEIDPENYDGHVLLIFSLTPLDYFDANGETYASELIASAKKLIELRPQSEFSLRITIGTAYFKLCKFDDALSEFRRSLAAKMADPVRQHRCLAWCLAAMEQNEEALEHMQRAREAIMSTTGNMVDPARIVILESIILALQRLGRSEEAAPFIHLLSNPEDDYSKHGHDIFRDMRKYHLEERSKAAGWTRLNTSSPFDPQYPPFPTIFDP